MKTSGMRVQAAAAAISRTGLAVNTERCRNGLDGDAGAVLILDLLALFLAKVGLGLSKMIDCALIEQRLDAHVRGRLSSCTVSLPGENALE